MRPGLFTDHSTGRALDLMIPNYRSASGKALGYDVAAWAKANAKSLGINYVIWNQHIWNVTRDSEGWRYMADRGGDSANHRTTYTSPSLQQASTLARALPANAFCDCAVRSQRKARSGEYVLLACGIASKPVGRQRDSGSIGFVICAGEETGNMALPRLLPAAEQVQVQDTAFTTDALGRFICSLGGGYGKWRGALLGSDRRSGRLWRVLRGQIVPKSLQQTCPIAGRWQSAGDRTCAKPRSRGFGRAGAHSPGE